MLLCATASAAELPRAKVEAIDRLVKAFMTTNGVPGLSIAVVADGKLQWSSGYGLADAENSVKTTDSTMFRTASTGTSSTPRSRLARNTGRPTPAEHPRPPPATTPCC